MEEKTKQIILDEDKKDRKFIVPDSEMPISEFDDLEKIPQKKTKRVVNKARNFAFLLYPDSMPDNAIDRLLGADNQVVISPLHQPESNETKAHYHGILKFDGPKSYEDINDRMIELYHCPRVQIIDDLGQAMRYLIHKGWPTKIQYPYELIRANFDIRKYFADDTFVIDIMQLCEGVESIRSYKSLVHYLIKNNKFDYLEKVAKMSYFFNKYFENE